jgi:hypothetical protein
MADDQDTTLALLGIAATKKPLDLTCPPENVLSAFIEDRIEPTAREMMLSHLNGCEDCYLTWETLSVFLAQNNVQAAQQDRVDRVDRVGIVQRLTNWFNSKPLWQTAVPGMALASLAVALVINMPSTLYNNSMTPSVVATTVDAGKLANSIHQMPVPWEQQTFGFNQSAYTTQVKAVGVGIWNASSALMSLTDPLPTQLDTDSPIDWQGSEYHNYYAFGQWTLDAWVLVNADYVKPEQWQLMNQSLQTLKSGLTQRQQTEPEAAIALQTIDKMKSSLDRLSRKADISAQSTLMREIELGLQKLFL